MDESGAGHEVIAEHFGVKPHGNLVVGLQTKGLVTREVQSAEGF
jgi:hypothetical protein